MEFYDIHEQTKYKITISKPEKMEELSDLFITKDELDDALGKHSYYFTGNNERTLLLNSVIASAVDEWGAKLDESGKKTLIIEDEELLDVLKEHYVSDFDISGRYGRHGDRICYARRYKRKKTKPTQGDVRLLWNYLMYGFRDKFGCYPSHIPLYDRHLSMFNAYKKIVGWRLVRKQICDKTVVKFFRQIWDNPGEFIK